MSLSIDFPPLLTGLACALTVSVVVNVALKKAVKVPGGNEGRFWEIELEGINLRSLGRPTFVKYINYLRKVIYSVPHWLFLYLDLACIELPTSQDVPETPHTPRLVPVDLPTLSPLQTPGLMSTEASFQLFEAPEFQVPGTPLILLQELSPLSPFQRFEWPSPMIPTEGTLQEVNSFEFQVPHYGFFDDSDTNNEGEMSFEGFAPSFFPVTPTTSVWQNYGTASRAVSERDSIMINMPDALTAEITIHGRMYDSAVLRSHLEDMQSKSHERQQPITLDITSSCENIGDAYDTIEEILYSCKDHIGSLSIAMGTNSTFLDFQNTSIGCRSSEMFTLPNLLHFSWSGDASYLPRPWGSLAKLPFTQLESLTLDCRLSVTDCVQILSLCEKIISFTATSVQDRVPVMHCNATRKTLNTLKSLKLHASVDIHSLFNFHTMYDLENVDFQFTSGTNADPAEFNIQWGRLRSNHIVI
ncbi:hypothetical protein BDZ94DRAFT_1326035 [Collybia nuda]|uniref:Uncharacterized protein n=1 Tax=Collybia nuda TaxID=64659 RepID=A0A9P6CE69_9AGAR|nr:hypothetical protein BDZ94DRAFT_1326035 [Collybia nuda]